jgi:hypothetical protein
VATAITSTSIVTVYPVVTPFYSAGNNVTIKATATGSTTGLIAKPTAFIGGANVVRERSVGAGLIAIIAAMLVL